MDFTVVPSSITTEIKVNFDLNIPDWQSMVEHYEQINDLYHDAESVIETHFEIDIGNGSIYHGWFVMNKGSNDENLLYFSMNDVQELSLDVKLLDSDEIPIELELKDKLTGAICENQYYAGYKMDDGIISFIYCFKKQSKSLKGHLTASFEPSKEKFLKEKIEKNYSSLFEEDGNEQDFKIISGKNEIRFNKSVLMKISPVFQADIERWEGSRQNNFEIPEEVASSATIFAFQNILRQRPLGFDGHRKPPGKNVLALGLYKFTHVYQIHPLHKIFGEYVGATLTNENLLEVAEVAFPAPGFDNKELLARVAEFLKKGNKGLMKEHLAILKERNLNGYFKLLELIVLEKN